MCVLHECRHVQYIWHAPAYLCVHWDCVQIGVRVCAHVLVPYINSMHLYARVNAYAQVRECVFVLHSLYVKQSRKHLSQHRICVVASFRLLLETWDQIGELGKEFGVLYAQGRNASAALDHL